MRKLNRIPLTVFFCLFFSMFISSYAQKDPIIPDTLCRLISFADTVYVTDADAQWTVERYRHACYGVSEERLRNPMWVLHIKGNLCGKLLTLVCQSADYYDRGNRRWIPMKRLKSVGNPSVDVTLESSDCQLLFQFEE